MSATHHQAPTQPLLQVHLVCQSKAQSLSEDLRDDAEMGAEAGHGWLLLAASLKEAKLSGKEETPQEREALQISHEWKNMGRCGALLC